MLRQTRVLARFLRHTVLGFIGLLTGLGMLLTPIPATAQAETETGVAAYYSNVFQGRRTASGQRYNRKALTAAHNRYPFGTRLRVTNLENKKSVEVRVNDRGPSTPGRIIDLSRQAARELGFLKAGVTEVQLEVLELGSR